MRLADRPFAAPAPYQWHKRAETGFLIADDKAPVIGKFLHRRHAPVDDFRLVAFERILRADQPPYIIDIERAQRRLGNQLMAFMRRVKTAAKQSHFGTVKKFARGGGHRLFRSRLACPARIFEAGQLLKPTGPRA